MPQLEVTTDDAMNALLNKHNEYDEGGSSLSEEQKEYIELAKLNRYIEGECERQVLNDIDDNSDDEADGRILTENVIKNKSESEADFERLTKVEVHHCATDDTTEIITFGISGRKCWTLST